MHLCIDVLCHSDKWVGGVPGESPIEVQADVARLQDVLPPQSAVRSIDQRSLHSINGGARQSTVWMMQAT